VKPVHGLRNIEADPQFELNMAAHLSEQPLVQSDHKIAPVRICAGADIGVNSIILPGVIIGREAVVRAGAVFTEDAPDLARLPVSPRGSSAAGNRRCRTC